MHRPLTTFAIFAVTASITGAGCRTTSAVHSRDAGHRNRDAASGGTGGGTGTVVGSMAPAGGPLKHGGDSGSGQFDAEHWQIVAAADYAPANCRVYEPRSAPPFSAVQWTGCGSACEKADVTQGISDWVVASAASTRHGVAYAYWSHPLGQSPGHDFVSRLVRLADGATVSALGTHFVASTCSESSELQTALMHYHLAGAQGQERSLYGIAADPPTSWIWAVPAPLTTSVPEGLVDFATDNRIFTVGNGFVYSLKPPSNVWQALEQPSSSLYGIGNGDLAVWVESNSARLRGWKDDGQGVRTLLENAPATTCAISVNDQAIVGVSSDGCLAGTNGIRLWTLARTGSEPTLRVSPKFGGKVFLTLPSNVRSWGNYAAVQVWTWDSSGARTAPPYFLVVDLTTWSVWKISGLSPYVPQESLWTLDDTYLYWGETDDASSDYYQVLRMVRVPLTALDSLGKRVLP